MTHTINGHPVAACNCGETWKVKRYAPPHWRFAPCPVHQANGKPVPQCGDECSCPSLATRHSPLATESQMYANLMDAVKLLNKMVENTHYNCTREEADLIWRLRFVTRMEP